MMLEALRQLNLLTWSFTFHLPGIWALWSLHGLFTKAKKPKNKIETAAANNFLLVLVWLFWWFLICLLFSSLVVLVAVFVAVFVALAVVAAIKEKNREAGK